MIIALLSDNHGSLPAALFQRLQGVDRILHLGDIGDPALLSDLEALAPTLAVRGNVDPLGLPQLPERRLLRVEGLEVNLRHQPWDPRSLREGSRALFAHGHTHLPRLSCLPDAWLLCPGALVRPRGGHPATYARLEILSKRIQVGIHALEDGQVLTQADWSRP